MAETSLPPAHPLARFQLLSSPLVAPGKCAVCGTPNRPVVDFGMTLEFYGAVYLCETCITEAGTVIGMVTAKKFAQATADSSRSFDEQLKSRELRTISDERFHDISMAVGLLSDVLLFDSCDDTIVVGGQAGETSPTIFDSPKEHDDGDDRLDDESIASTTGNSEQDDDTIVGEGSISIPSDSKHGSSFDF